ncbi:hypothetical protein PENSPDRAFT_179821 [Peniophora sp. CONT]|nr:hypothetical protein PENSPDRAFT_179821 [Peniophora sp. CONT]
MGPKITSSTSWRRCAKTTKSAEKCKPELHPTSTWLANKIEYVAEDHIECLTKICIQQCLNWYLLTRCSCFLLTGCRLFS